MKALLTVVMALALTPFFANADDAAAKSDAAAPAAATEAAPATDAAAPAAKKEDAAK